jgi:ribosomal protein S2
MKLRKIKQKKYKLLKLHLLKSQVYKNNLKNKIFEEHVSKNLEQTELYFKKALKIIYESHLNNFKILFVGLPKMAPKVFEDLLKSTPHFFIPSNLWINSFFANRVSISRFLTLKKQNFDRKISMKNINNLLSIRTKPRLVVVLDQDIKTDLVKELVNLDIPVILFGTHSSFSSQVSYPIPGNFFFVNKKITNIVLFLICSIFKNTQIPLKSVSQKKSDNFSLPFTWKEHILPSFSKN